MPEYQSHPPSPPVRVRVRARQACTSCKKRKRKCNGLQPCGECVGYGYECSYQLRISKAARRAQSVSGSSFGFPKEETPDRNLQLNSPPIHRDRDHDMNSDDTISRRPVRTTSISEIPVKEQSMLEPFKSRFVSAHSMIASSRLLGIELKMSKPPRLHSYAWHAGIRAERSNPIPPQVCDLLSLEEAIPFIDSYFNCVNPVFATLNRENFIQRCKLYYTSSGLAVDFEAVICSVVALGSLFSGPNPCSVEWELVEQARLVLNSPNEPPGPVSLDHIVGWILRCLYLRLTTRPNIGWLAICTTMHLVESVGLHQEIDMVSFAVEGSSPQLFGLEELEARRRIFWVAWSLNRLFAAEYGRSIAHIDNIRCRRPSARDDEYVCGLIDMTDLLHGGPMQETLAANGAELVSALERLAQIPTNHNLLTALKADICMILCRRLKLTHRKISSDLIPLIIETIHKGLCQCRSFALLQYPWWSVMCLPFQSVCLLLSLNSPHECFDVINQAMETLVEVSLIFDTHLAREALNTARLLIRHAARRKRDELHRLEELAQEPGSNSSVVPLSETTDIMDGKIFEGLLEDDLGWTQFFGPDLLPPEIEQR